jgi:hypothetical protein
MVLPNICLGKRFVPLHENLVELDITRRADVVVAAVVDVVVMEQWQIQDLPPSQ